MKLKRRPRIHWETINLNKKRFPLQLAGALGLMAVILLLTTWLLTSRYTDVQPTLAWEISLDSVQEAKVMTDGTTLVLTEAGELVIINAQGVAGTGSLPPGEVVGLCRWGVLVERSQELYLERLEGGNELIAPFPAGSHVFIMEPGLLVVETVAEGWTVGDRFLAWQPGREIKEWSWDDRVLLKVVNFDEGYAGVYLDSGKDQLTVALCRFSSDQIVWEQELGSELPVGLSVVGGQLLVARGEELVAWGAEGEVRWTHQTSATISDFAAGSRGSLVVEALGFSRHRLSHIDPLGEKAWERTLSGEVQALQTGGRFHGVLLDGRLWFMETTGGRVFRTEVMARWIYLDGQGRHLTTVQEDGTIKRFFLDSLLP